MKKILALLLASVGTSALALPLAYDAFNYPLSPTNLTAQTTSLSWKDAGAAASITNRPYMTSGSLNYAGLAPSIGNSIIFGGRGQSAHLDLPSSIYSSNTVYYSFILKVTDIGKLGTGTAGVFFAAVTGGSFTGTEPVLLVSGLLAKKVGPTQYVLGIKKASAGAAFSGNSTGPTTEITNNVGDVVFVVASYHFVTYPGGTGDEARLWINPSAGSFGGASPPTETILSSGSADLAVSGYPLTGFTFFNRQTIDEPGAMQADELTVSTSWADVTPTASALAFISQPHNQRTVAGGQATFSVTTFRASTNQWQHNGIDIAGANNSTLTITNVQAADAGTYHVIIGNGVNSLVSSNVTLTVYPDVYPRLIPLWSIAPFSRQYMTTDGGNTPNQRYFAYNALSNTVLLVSRTNTSYNYITNPAVYVLNADSGADLYQMNADPAVISGGADIDGGGTNFLSLVSIDATSDGAVYAANVGNSSTHFHLYYWPDSAASTEPLLVFDSSDPSGGFVSNARFGDNMAARGTGTATEVLIVDQTGTGGTVLEPQVGHPVSDPWNYIPFTDVVGGQSGGRTLLYYGTDNTFWEKHGGSGLLNLVSYDTTAHTSALVTNYANVTGNPNLVSFNSSTNLLLAINRTATAPNPDTVDQYDYSDPSNPLFVRSYSFPVSHAANNNGYGRLIVNGDRVFALDANNGMAAFRIEPVLHLTTSGGNAVLSWSDEVTGYSLKSSTSVSAPVSGWTDLGSGTHIGNQYWVTNSAASDATFYILKK